MEVDDIFLNPLNSHFKWHNFKLQGGARGVMVIVVGNGHGNTSSNPGRD